MVVVIFNDFEEKVMLKWIWCEFSWYVGGYGFYFVF